MNKFFGWKTFNDRIALYILSILFGIIIADGAGAINVEKWGYAFLGAMITVILQFYFRKKNTETDPEDKVGKPQ